MTTYSVESIIHGVGYLRPAEERALREILGTDADFSYDTVTAQIHLHWLASGDSLFTILDEARSTLRDATDATGVFSPRTKSFSVREIDE